MGHKASLDDLGQVEEQMSRVRHTFRFINHGLMIAFPKSGSSVAWCRCTYQKGSYPRDRYLLNRPLRAQDDDYITRMYEEVKPFRDT